MDTYEQKYKEALERARRLYEQGTITESLSYVFPELAESDFEKNIKDLIDELKCSLKAANCQNDACRGGHEKRIALLEWAIAWLEKQGNKQKKTSIWTEEDDTIRCEIIKRMEALDHYWNRPNDQKLIDWIKSIKQRMEEQQ